MFEVVDWLWGALLLVVGLVVLVRLAVAFASRRGDRARRVRSALGPIAGAVRVQSELYGFRPHDSPPPASEHAQTQEAAAGDPEGPGAPEAGPPAR